MKFFKMIVLYTIPFVLGVYCGIHSVESIFPHPLQMLIAGILFMIVYECWKTE